MTKFISIAITSLLLSCGSTPSQNRDAVLDQVYMSSGVEKYFHLDIPHWAHFSSAGQCFRSSNTRYLNFDNLSKSLNLNYTQMVHMQYMINRKLFAYKSTTGSKQLPLKDQAFVFNNVHQRVSGGSFDFIVPKFERISVIWIDSFLKDTKKLNKIVRSNKVLSGHPVLMSHCLNSFEMEELAQELKLDELNVKYLSSEMLSIYDQNIKRQTFFSLDISKLFENKKVFFYGKSLSPSLTGEFDFNQL